ncbi:MAG: Lhr family ATP-dependent helicase, partial [Gammaproteobacteria bacterium]
MRAEDLLAVVFPDQVACLEHLSGRREIPDHPLVRQTLCDCLTDAMDIEGLEALLKTIEAGRIRLLARDLTEPSPLAQEILNARPYAFLDDAPLEERRTQAILSRRWLDIESVERLGQLDPGAIERVRAEAWPEVSTADELHEALTSAGFVTEFEGRRSAVSEAASAGDWGALLEQLTLERRATIICHGEWRAWVTVERLPELLACHPGAAITPALQVPAEYRSKAWTAVEALAELLHSRLEVLGPTTPAALASECGLAEPSLRAALLTLESQGYVLRGDFTGQDREEWCERRLLARIHRYTVQRLRQEIEPVAAADFLRFLFRWQHVDPATRLSGEPALPAVLERLEGFEAAAASWEEELLPARLRDYDPAWIDCLCLSGRMAWRRRPAAPPAGNATGPLRSTPITFLARQREWPAEPADSGSIELSPHAGAVAESLRRQGALFTEDLIAELGYLQIQVEQALAELVVKGIVSCDSFAGLRLLLAPASGRYRRSRRRGWVRDHAAGRWVLVQKRLPTAPAPDPLLTQDPAGALEACAWILLRRYGV